MRAGKLNRRITLTAPLSVRQPSGHVVQQWNPVATVFAAIEETGGREPLRDGVMDARVDARVTIRWRQGVTAEMRLSIGAVMYLIHAVYDPDQRRQQLVLLTERVDGANLGSP